MPPLRVASYGSPLQADIQMEPTRSIAYAIMLLKRAAHLARQVDGAEVMSDATTHKRKGLGSAAVIFDTRATCFSLSTRTAA